MPDYLCYLLRLRRVDGQEAKVWRVSLQRPGALETIGLADLVELLAFLRTEMNEGTAPELLGCEQALLGQASRD
jgi:hypothetical protein